MDFRVDEPLGCGAPFGSNTLIPGLPNELVVSILWPKIGRRLYFLIGSTLEAEVRILSSASCDCVSRAFDGSGRVIHYSKEWPFGQCSTLPSCFLV